MRRVNHEDPERRPAAADNDTAILLEACLDSSRLFSLQPDEVLQETERLFATVVGADRIIVLPAARDDWPDGDGPGAAETALFRRVVAERRPLGDARLQAVPLLARGDGERRLVGVALFSGRSELLSDREAALLDFVAARAAVALEHALRYQTQARISRELQTMLLPHDAPEVPGLDFGVLYRSGTVGAEVGGDFVDFISLSCGQVVIAVGDVSGKGIRASATTVMVKYALRALIATLSWPTWPGEALRDLHNAVQGQLDTYSFVTAAIGTLDVTRRTLAVASAGHPVPFIVRADGGVERPLLLTAPAVALVDYSELEPYPTERLTLSPGDTVLFHTDGIGELRNARGEHYETERMAKALAEYHDLPPADLVERLLEDALAFSGTSSSDDIALVATRLRQPGA